MHNRLKEQWANGETTIGGWLSIPDAFAAEVMAGVGMDYLCIDTQHGLADFATSVQMMASIELHGGVPIVRVPWNEPGILGRSADAGARGVIIPMVNTRAEAEAAVAGLRYPPAGNRSWGPVRASRMNDAYSTDLANEALAVIPMIETAQAVENLDDILSVPGVDAIYIGPADLSISLGLPPASDHDGVFTEAIETIVAGCKNHGVVPGVHTDTEYVAKRREQGFKMITVCSDASALAAAAEQAVAIGRGEATAGEATSLY